MRLMVEGFLKHFRYIIANRRHIQLAIRPSSLILQHQFFGSVSSEILSKSIDAFYIPSSNLEKKIRIFIAIPMFYFRFLSVKLNQLRNKFLANYLRSGGNKLATVRFSAICGAMLPNNSFMDNATTFLIIHKAKNYLFSPMSCGLFQSIPEIYVIKKFVLVNAQYIALL